MLQIKDRKDSQVSDLDCQRWELGLELGLDLLEGVEDLVALGGWG